VFGGFEREMMRYTLGSKKLILYELGGSTKNILLNRSTYMYNDGLGE